MDFFLNTLVLGAIKNADLCNCVQRCLLVLEDFNWFSGTSCTCSWLSLGVFVCVCPPDHLASRLDLWIKRLFDLPESIKI